MENERVYFCLTCQTVTCTSCVIDEDGGHDVTEADELHKQNMNDVRNLLKSLDRKVKRQRDAKAKIRTTRDQIAKSYQRIEDTVKEKAAKMIKNIKKQEEDILRKLHQTRDQELEPLLEKLDTVEWYLANAQRFNSKTRCYKNCANWTKTDETTCSSDLTWKVKFLAGQTEPVVGRLEVVERRAADNSGASTADMISIVTAAARPVPGEETGGSNNPQGKRVLRVSSLIRGYGKPALWGHVCQHLVVDGVVDVRYVLTRAGLEDLSYVLTSCDVSQVSRLDLSGNNNVLKDVEAARLLAAAVRDNDNIREIDLGWCHLLDDGLKVIADGVSDNLTTFSLYLESPPEWMRRLESEFPGRFHKKVSPSRPFYHDKVAILSLDRDLVLVERLACASDPRGYGAQSLVLPVGPPMAHMSEVRSLTNSDPATTAEQAEEDTRSVPNGCEGG
ncbi:hypothetical protein NP493_1347g00016 [Ridgeia piscesae]|uniref:Uncharacterized protein n=1 Tax=Ridgeia piscesae TaxID=27915 RepID=A0AAD9K7G8_RIDPI|nr:hypothetical protein NP493_1347g00016 [Ridgeia piscesae]